MKKNTPHIISNLNWETTFDKKEWGHELQQRVSTWSHHRLTKIIEDVLDAMCPSGQTWKISLIELDLGKVGYQDLESRLALNLKNQLSEELKRLLLYAGNGENLRIEVESRSMPELDLLGSFLLRGYMSWSHSDEVGSPNILMASLLETNFDEVIAMVRRIGATHENVRKRLAWQISEESIIKIIRGLEPANHRQITDFSHELKELQKKKNIVKSGSGDFRKNMWLWTLNYLLAEKGTLFNKVAFMKSNIRQMAAHYNLSYDQLLSLIDDALETVKKHSLIQPEFIRALQLITEESKKKNTALTQIVSGSSDWQTLENYFKEDVLPEHLNPARLSELIAGLHESDEERFSRMMTSLSNERGNWTQFAWQLNDRAYQTLLYVIDPVNSDVMVKVLSIMEQLGKANPALFTKQDLRETAIAYLQKRKPLSRFISHCMDKLVRPHLGSASKIILPAQQLSSTLMSIDHFSFFEEIRSYIGTEDVAAEKERYGLDEILQLYLQKKNNHYVNEAREIILRQPKESIDAILKTGLKAEMLDLFRQALDNDTSAVLLDSLDQSWHRSIKMLRQLDEIIKADKDLVLMHGYRPGALMKEAAFIAIKHPSLKPLAFLRMVLKSFGRYLTPAQQRALNGLTEQVFFNVGATLYADADMLSGAQSKVLPGPRQFSFQQLLRLTSITKYDKVAVAGLFSAHFSNLEFARFRSQTDTMQKRLLEFFVSGGGNEATHIIQKTIEWIDTNDPAAEQELTELYWKVALSYKEHSGSQAAFERLFSASVIFNFQLSPNKRRNLLLKSGIKKPRVIESHNEDVLYRLLMSIENGIEGGSKNELSAKALPLGGLVIEALRSAPSSLRKMMTNITPTAKRIEALKHDVEFAEFIKLISHDTDGSVKRGAEALDVLWQTILLFASQSLVSKLLDEFWKQAWLLLKNKSWSQQKTILFATSLFEKLASESDLNANDIMDGITKCNIRMSAALGDALIQSLPGTHGSMLVQDPPALLEKARSKDLLPHLIHTFISNQKLPSWFSREVDAEERVIINEILLHYPVHFYHCIKTQPLQREQVSWLHELAGGKPFFEAAAVQNNGNRNLLEILSAFYISLGNITMDGVSSKELQLVLLGKFFMSWKTGNWKVLSTENIWNELVWELVMKKGMKTKDVLDAFHHHRHLLPPALLAEWNRIKAPDRSTVFVKRGGVKKKVVSARKMIDEKAVAEGIVVRNAGLVLLSSFIPTLFERLGLLTASRTFVSEDAKADAVHYLQYVVTGHSSTEEAYLPLNKLLCGMQLNEPVREGIEISAEHEAIVSGLIGAAISYWPKAGDSSVSGFRGNWLVRNGILSNKNDRWELNVEKRAYDLLIHQSPFSFSIIKLPWMREPLYVNWPY
jgi:hypothetical protein